MPTALQRIVPQTFRIVRHGLVGLALAVLAPAGAMAASITSNFDAGLDGWTGLAGQTTVSHEATGGQSGGYMRALDIQAGQGQTSFVIAPSSYLGNLSGFIGGTLSVAALEDTTNGNPINANFGTIHISGGGDTAVARLLRPLSARVWRDFSVDLTASNWTTSSLSFAAIMANVTDIRLHVDYRGQGNEAVGIDNFAIQSTEVPAPPAVALFAGAALVLLGRKTGRRAAASN